jgi:hypothetical protein
MSRQHINYSARTPVVRTFEGYNPDVPKPGFYRMRLRSGGAYVGVKVWFGAPLDPVTGEEMDRSHRFQAEINGAYAELDRVWPRCAGDPITEAEYQHLCATQQWAQQHAPDSALAQPTRRFDPLSSPLLF